MEKFILEDIKENIKRINLFNIIENNILGINREDEIYYDIIEKIFEENYKYIEINKKLLLSIFDNTEYLTIEEEKRKFYYKTVEEYVKILLPSIFLELYKENNKEEIKKDTIKGNFEKFLEDNYKIFNFSKSNLILKLYGMLILSNKILNDKKEIDIFKFLSFYILTYIYNDKLYDYIDNTYNKIRYIDYIINKYKTIKLDKVYPFTLMNIQVNGNGKIKINKLYFKDKIRNPITYNTEITPLIIKRVLNKYINPEDKLYNEINKQFIEIKEYPKRDKTDLITINKEYYNFKIPNMIMYDYLLFDQLCYFQSSLKLILTIFNIKLPEQISKINYKEKLKEIFKKANITNEEKINKLIEFYDILIHSNSPYILTNIYNFLIRNGYDKFIKYIGIPNYNIEPGFIITIFLKLLYQIDKNMYNYCGIELNDKEKTKTFILNINEPEFIKDLSSKEDNCKFINFKNNLFGGEIYDEIKQLYYDKDNYDCIKEVNLNNYLRYNYDKILNLTDQINNTPEILFININTIFNNISNKSNLDNLNISTATKCYNYFSSLYYQYYPNRFVKYCDTDYLYLSNKYIKIKDTYYKLFCILNTNAKGGHTELEILNTKENIFCSDKITQKLKVENINYPIIYVYKKCNFEDLYLYKYIDYYTFKNSPYKKPNIILELNNKLDISNLNNFFNIFYNNNISNIRFFLNNEINFTLNYINNLYILHNTQISKDEFFEKLKKIDYFYHTNYNLFLDNLNKKNKNLYKKLSSLPYKISKDKYLFYLFYYFPNYFINFDTYKLFYLNNTQTFYKQSQINDIQKIFKFFDYQDEQQKSYPQQKYISYDFYNDL